MEEPIYPMWINKYLALKGYATRRGGDELVKQGKVKINGKPAIPTDKVNKTDVVEVKKDLNKKPYVYLAYNKPKGVITHSPQGDEKDIKSVINVKDVAPIGRLDKDSSGLIILTNDGRITDRLLNPKYIHEKEYMVTVARKLRSSFQQKMSSGVVIEGYKTKPSRVEIVNDFIFKITLTEGKKHQIRRMVSALFNEVKDLKRIRIMNIRLGSLALGAHRPIEGKELDIFLKSLGL